MNKFKIALDSQTFKAAVNKLKVFALNDDTRPVLCAINLTGNRGDTKLTMTGCDGFKLGIIKLAITKPLADKLEVNLPVRELKRIVKGIYKKSRKIQLNINNDKFCDILSDGINIGSLEIIQGTYPNVPGVLEWEKEKPTLWSTLIKPEVNIKLQAALKSVGTKHLKHLAIWLEVNTNRITLRIKDKPETIETSQLYESGKLNKLFGNAGYFLGNIEINPYNITTFLGFRVIVDAQQFYNALNLSKSISINAHGDKYVKQSKQIHVTQTTRWDNTLELTNPNTYALLMPINLNNTDKYPELYK